MEILDDSTVWNEDPSERKCVNSANVDDISKRSSPICQSNQQMDTGYDMSGNKIVIIFNHYEYMTTRFYRNLHVSTRHGTFKDVKNLKETFKGLGFVVITHHDFKHKDILKYLHKVSVKDHSRTSCLAVVVMSHGYGEYLCAADCMYLVSELTNALRSAPSLAGKPKLFFIQACREGHTRPVEPPTVPLDTHYLLYYSCYEDFVSYRQGEGTWMIRALCEVLSEHHKRLHLTDMLTLVNAKVAGMSGQDESGVVKQMPECMFFLQKPLML